MSSMTKQSARERITSLFDENSFVEVGALVTKRNTDFNLGAQEVPADGVVTGYGLVNGNLVYAYSQDADALGGSMGEMHARKIAGIYDLATKCGAPVVGILDCQGLRLQEGCDALDAFGQVYAKQALAAGVIPQISAVLGVCGGGAAVLAGLSDFTVMTKENAKLFVNAPNTLDGNYTEKNNTAGAAFQSEQGNVDILAEDDADALNKVRELLSVLPLNNEDGVFNEECTDDLNRTVESLTGLKDAAVIAREISDNRQFIELKKDFAKGIVTGFIKLNGMTVGFVGNRSEILDDAFKCVEKVEPKLCACRAKKAAEFVNFCDAFNIPVVTFTNVTGYVAKVDCEGKIAKAVAGLSYAFANADVPKVNVVYGEAYGSAYIAMNSKHIGADLVFAYPDAKIGMMDSASAAKIVETDAAKYDEMLNNPVSAAKRGYVDSIIEPASTRKQLIYAFEMLYTKRELKPAKKHGRF